MHENYNFLKEFHQYIENNKNLEDSFCDTMACCYGKDDEAG